MVTGSAAAAVALIGTVVGVGLSRPTTSQVTPPIVPPSAPAPAAESACGLRGTLDDEATGAVTARWETSGVVSLPVSSTDGPGHQIEAGPWSCYTRTPSGAVLAGITIALRADGVAENWQDVVRQQTIPGPGQDAALAGPLAEGELVSLRGFDVAAYSPDRATVRYYLHTPASDTTCTTDVQWSDDDWKLVLGDDGSTASGCQPGAPQEFTPWGP